jgi:hypothetical protein
MENRKMNKTHTEEDLRNAIEMVRERSLLMFTCLDDLQRIIYKDASIDPKDASMKYNLKESDTPVGAWVQESNTRINDMLEIQRDKFGSSVEDVDLCLEEMFHSIAHYIMAAMFQAMPAEVIEENFKIALLRNRGISSDSLESISNILATLAQQADEDPFEDIPDGPDGRTVQVVTTRDPK